MSWNSELGIWKFGIFRGTTPRNADVWTLDIVVGQWELWLGSGAHAYITLFKGPKEVFNRERNRKNCPCFTCSMHRPLEPEIWEALREKYKPVGCQPSDCCGDLSAHGTPHECSKGCVC